MCVLKHYALIETFKTKGFCIYIFLFLVFFFLVFFKCQFWWAVGPLPCQVL